jgi:salicylate hydroxylase
VVHRAALLGQLLKSVPRERMHTNRKLVRLTNADNGGVILHFEDGTEEYADALIGADGIHGYVREYVLGAENPAAKACLSGFWATRSLVPLERAKEVLGEEYFQEPRQYGWCGDSGFLMHDWLDNGKTIQCVMSVLEENWSSDEVKRDLDLEKLEEVFSCWTNSPVIEGMIEVGFSNRDRP